MGLAADAGLGDAASGKGPVANAPSALGKKAKFPEHVSIVQLIAVPDRYEGRVVGVQGFVRLEFEGTAVYMSEDDYRYRNSKNAIWLRFTDTYPKDDTDDGQWCFVVGYSVAPSAATSICSVVQFTFSTFAHAEIRDLSFQSALREPWNLPAAYIEENSQGDATAQAERDAVDCLASVGLVLPPPSGKVIGKNPFTGEPVVETSEMLIMNAAYSGGLMNGTIPIATEGLQSRCLARSLWAGTWQRLA
jgi:hypothetical protein